MKKEYKNLLIWKSDDLGISNFNESSDYLITQKELNYRLVGYFGSICATDFGLLVPSISV